MKNKKENPYMLEYRSFQKYIKGETIPFFDFIKLLLKSLLQLIEMSIRYIPGGIGYKLRYYYYKPFLKHLGKCVLIDTGVFLNGPRNISLGDYVWIDGCCRLEAMLGEITVGHRVHIAPFSIIAAREPVNIGDYVGISSGVKIYANSEHPFGGKRVSGPMIPEEYKAIQSKRIILGKDSFVGVNAVLLPGAELGEGTIIGANSTVNQKIEPWTVAVGTPARVVRRRDRVVVPDI